MMAYDNEMTERVRAELKDMDNVEEKSMFGSLGFMIDGKLKVCVGKDSVMYRMSTSDRDELVGLDIAKPVVMGKRTTKNWVYIANSNLVKDANFKGYLNRSLVY